MRGRSRVPGSGGGSSEGNAVTRLWGALCARLEYRRIQTKEIEIET